MEDNLSTYSSLSIDEIFEEFKTSKNGLSEEAAKKRLALYGQNMISNKKEVGIIWEFLSHFKSPLVIILLLAALVSSYFGESTNSIIIAILVFVSVTLDFFEEHSASKAAEKLKERVANTATVIRSAKKKEVKTSQICVGDIIFLSSGDLIPADARILEADDFFVNESALTGESYPHEKSVNAVQNSENSSNYDNLIFLGSNVVSGTALAVVFHTGKETEFGKIAKDILRKEDKSEFELSIGKFGFFLMRIILFLVLFIFLFNTLVNKNVIESFLFSIAIAVGITPELLPMIMSITMARGSIRMAKVGVIVKKLSSIPNFGSMDILCTDKTGTLTEDKITLISYTDIFGNPDDNVFLYTYLNSFFQTGIKNPLDKAVLEYKKTQIKQYKKVEEIPFDFVRKMMSIAVSGPEGTFLITKGAPEEVLAKCNYYSSQENQKKLLSSKTREAALNYYNQLSTDGYRVLAVAKKISATAKSKYTHADETQMELIGFVAFLDPAKKGVKEVLLKLKQRGIEVKVITGDNELVAKKICTDVGLKIKGVLLGKDIDSLTDDALKVRAERTTIFARFSPDEKNRIITVLRGCGHVVGYLGDGINDAPSIKTADVGISVENAVDVAKESADIILTQKNLSSIVDGVGEGRRAFGNTMKYIMMGLSSNFGNMFSMTGAIFFLPFLPMLPVQILLNNLIYDFSQVTIPSDNVDHEWIAQPRKWDLDFIKKFMYVFGPISSIFDFLTFFVLFYVFKTNSSVFQTGWFMESLATQTLVVHIIRTRQIPFLQSKASKYLIISTVAAVLVGWLIPFTFFGKFFQFSALPIPILLIIIGLVLTYLILVEIIKRIFYKKYGFID